MALLALAAVVVAGLRIYNEAKDAFKDEGPPALKAELENLAASGERLATSLETLVPSSGGDAAEDYAHRAVVFQRKAIAALKQRRDDGEVTPQERETEDALNKEFDWLDGVETVLANPESRVLKELGERGEEAIDAFDVLEEDRGVGATIRGVAKLTAWAKAKRSE